MARESVERRYVYYLLTELVDCESVETYTKLKMSRDLFRTICFAIEKL